MGREARGRGSGRERAETYRKDRKNRKMLLYKCLLVYLLNLLLPTVHVRYYVLQGENQSQPDELFLSLAALSSILPHSDASPLK